MNEHLNDEEGRRQRRKKRRSQRRLVIMAGFFVLAVMLAWFFESQATTTVIVTRYADKVELGGSDPALSSKGQRRARRLGRMLANVDVVGSVDAIFVTTSRRTRDTIVPLSLRTEAPVITHEDPDDTKGLVKRILTEHKGDIVLVVTEPEEIKPLLRRLQGSRKVPEIAVNEYDNLYIVSIPWFGKVKTLRLRWGFPYQPPKVPVEAPVEVAD